MVTDLAFLRSAREVRLKDVALRVLVTLGLSALLSSCLPAPAGPSLEQLRLVPAGPWRAEDLLNRSELPSSQLLPLGEALRRAPPGSLLVACEYAAAMWGPCRHLTRKLSEDLVVEQPGWFGRGAMQLPLSSLMRRDLVLVVDAGVRPEHMAAMQREIRRLGEAPYMLNGTVNAFDCGTYQNALQRAMGLPEAVPLDPRWRAYLPSGVLSVPSNTLLFAGASTRLLRQLAGEDDLADPSLGTAGRS